MIQRMSDQHKIKFLEKEKDIVNKQKTAGSPKKTIGKIAEEQKAKKISNKDDGLMTTQHIFSARTGSITNEGGPSTHIKSESSNSIWESDKTAKASKEIDNKTKTLQEKANIESNKREAENKRMNDLAESLKSTLQDKDSSVTPVGTLSGTNYKSSKNNMSIFDSSDFARLKDKTGGEKVSEEIAKKKNHIDDSWRNGGKVVSSKDITKSMFEGFFMKKEE